MMKRSKRLISAAAVGLVATGGLYFYLLHEPPKAESAIPMQTVLVVTQPIPAQSRIQIAQFSVQNRPASFVPAGSVGDPKLAEGRLTKEAIYPGETVLEEKLMPPGAENPLAFMLPTGYRAVTVAVDEVVGVAGFLMPGTMVDVVSTIDIDGRPATKIILQKIRVLAIAQDAAKKDSPQAKVVSSATLAVTPEDSEKLVLAADKGRIRLAIRSPKEDAKTNTFGVTSESLVGKSEPKAAPKVVTKVVREVVTKNTFRDRPIPAKAPVRQEPTIMVIRGGNIEMVQR